MSKQSLREEKKRQKNTQKLFKWFQKSEFWQNHVSEYREIDLFTYVIFCKNLNLSSLRFHVDWHRDYIAIIIDTILPVEYETEIGLGSYKISRSKNGWLFAPYVRPPMYSEEHVSKLLRESISKGSFDKICDTLNRDEAVIGLINRLSHEKWTNKGMGDNTYWEKVHEFFVPIVLMNDENGLNIRLSTHYSRKSAKADNLILGILDKMIGRIMDLDLPELSKLDNEIDALLGIYADWETDGFGKKTTQSQIQPTSETKYCTECGKQLEKQAKFCSECGFHF